MKVYFVHWHDLCLFHTINDEFSGRNQARLISKDKFLYYTICLFIRVRLEDSKQRFSIRMNAPVHTYSQFLPTTNAS
jgi:hypothetical protein